MTTPSTTCLICGSTFTARHSYGLCPQCIRRDTLREYDRLRSASRFADRAKLPNTLTLLQWLSVVSDWRGKCALCEEMVHHEIAMLNPIAGLVWENVVPVCRSCSQHLHHGFETALKKAREYLTANVGRTEEDIRLEDVELDDEELFNLFREEEVK